MSIDNSISNLFFISSMWKGETMLREQTIKKEYGGNREFVLYKIILTKIKQKRKFYLLVKMVGEQDYYERQLGEKK